MNPMSQLWFLAGVAILLLTSLLQFDSGSRNASFRFLSGNVPECLRGRFRGHVYIVGAGISGLSAARELRELSPNLAVTIVEASSRIGGRIHTNRDFNATIPLERGAMFIHRISENPLTEFILANNIPHEVFNYSLTQYYFPNGTRAPFDLFRQTYDFFIEFMDTTFRQYKARLPLDNDEPLFTTFDELDVYNELTGDERLLFDLFCFQYILQEEQADLTDISTVSYAMGYDFHETDEDWTLPSGYDSLLHELSQGLDILMRVQIESIEQRPDGRVQLKGAGQELVGDVAIVSVPIGVLKKGGISFRPALPITFRNAIADLAVSSSVKLELCWESPFWDASVPQFHKYASSCMEGGLEKCKYGQGEHIEFINVKGGPCLLVSVETKLASLIAGGTEEEGAARIMHELRLMFGEIPEPVYTKVIDWGGHPLTLGGYSHWRVDSGRKDNEVLCEPLFEGRLHFAGEHTSADWYGSVHGAYLSGQRSVERLLFELAIIELIPWGWALGVILVVSFALSRSVLHP